MITCVPLTADVQQSVEKLLSDTALHECLQLLYAAQADVFLVGGAVRDLFLGRVVQDIDCEVHGISLDQLEQILRGYSPVSVVGKSFGVIRVHGIDVDW